MKRRAQGIDFRGLVEHRHEADERLKKPGDAVVVRRGVDRSLTMACPDGCGEVLTINLDRRAGAAWRLYLDHEALSLYPSVWRHTGCNSHFIVWRSHVYWCDWEEEFEPTSAEFEELVLGLLNGNLQPYAAVAEHLGVVPWAVLSACLRLRQSGFVQSGLGEQRNCFRLTAR